MKYIFGKWQVEKMKNNECVRLYNPLVHCITNYVTVNDVANVVLACGGSPIMADDIDEVAEITAISNVLVLNIGTLNQRTVASMIKAGKVANQKGIPVVLDPVGAGASSLRNATTKKLLEEIKFTVIRGNLSEVSFIAGLTATTRGVDSSEVDNKNNASMVARKTAEKYHCVVAITGAVDIISDGIKIAKIANGVPQMSKITGTGCMLSGIIGAYVSTSVNTFDAVVSAVASMAIAGEIAYQKYKNVGTGSLRIGIMDAISVMNDEMIKSKGNICYE